MNATERTGLRRLVMLAGCLGLVAALAACSSGSGAVGSSSGQSSSASSSTAVTSSRPSSVHAQSSSMSSHTTPVGSSASNSSATASTSRALPPPSDAGADARLDAPVDGTRDAASPDAWLDATVDAGVQSGTLIGGTGPYPGAIQGVHYRTATQSGYTSAAGGFAYLAGETVTFSVADVDFAPTPGTAYVSPWQLASPQTCAPSSELTSLLMMLYSLDQDGDPTDGTQIPEATMGSSPRRAFSSLSPSDIQALVSQLVPGRADAGLPVDGGTAIVDYVTQMDDEVWQQVGLDTFTGTDAVYRTQGVATDGTDFYFTWQLGFEKTDLAYDTLEKNLDAIPVVISAADYDDHIGDVDCWNGSIYAGLEDDGTGESTPYTHPRIAQYDADLNYVQSWPLSDTLMNQGVPWVAVDGPNSHLIIANWSPTPALYILDLSTTNYLYSIPLSQQLVDIQGAKLFEGSLYTSAFDGPMTIAKVDMQTGVVIVLWRMTDPGYDLPSGAEEEGCVFLAMADGSQFHTLNNDKDDLAVQLRHHQRIRDPLRKLVCP